jgi:hypothetical protein
MLRVEPHPNEKTLKNTKGKETLNKVCSYVSSTALTHGKNGNLGLQKITE